MTFIFWGGVVGSFPVDRVAFDRARSCWFKVHSGVPYDDEFIGKCAKKSLNRTLYDCVDFKRSFFAV